MREKLKEHCLVISGYAFKSADLQEKGEIPVVKIGNISNGRNIVIDDDTQYVDSEFLSLDSKYHIRKGDILISLTGSHMNQPNSMVGRSCRSYNDSEYLLNQRAGKVICYEGTDPDYIYYLLTTKAIKESIVNRAYGAANQVNVSPSDVMGIKWDFHEYKEQKKIGHILSAYDQLIDVNTKRISALEKTAEQFYIGWFILYKYPGSENAKFIAQNPKSWILKRSKKMYIPDNWHYGELKELGEFIRGKNITAAEMIDGEIPVISAGLQPSGYHNKANVYGDSLTISASGANAGYLKYHLSDIWAADCSYYQNAENLWFVYSSLRFLQPVISNLQCGAAQPHVYPKHINRLQILIPDDDTISAYCELVKPIFDEIRILQNKNEMLIKQRNMILPRLMGRRLKV